MTILVTTECNCVCFLFFGSVDLEQGQRLTRTSDSWLLSIPWQTRRSRIRGRRTRPSPCYRSPGDIRSRTRAQELLLFGPGTQMKRYCLTRNPPNDRLFYPQWLQLDSATFPRLFSRHLNEERGQSRTTIMFILTYEPC